MIFRHRAFKNTVRVCLTLCMGWALTAAFSGCGRTDRGPERVIVSGTVTYNGKAIANGVIRFVPAASSLVPTSGAKIEDGKYNADGHGGVPVGTHRIQIEAYRTVPIPAKAGVRLPPDIAALEGLPQQYLPKKYNTASELEITLQPGSRQITKSFELTD